MKSTADPPFLTGDPQIEGIRKIFHPLSLLQYRLMNLCGNEVVECIGDKRYL